MNAVLDLTARAVSFISLIQTTLFRASITAKKDFTTLSVFKPGTAYEIEKQLKEAIKEEEKNKSDDYNFVKRAVELVWISTAEPGVDKAVNYALKICLGIVDWIQNNPDQEILSKIRSCGRYPTPHNWRMVIIELLYKDPEQRVLLAHKLQYLPIEVMLALGGGRLTSHHQRILLFWNAKQEDHELLLLDSEIKLLDKLNEYEKTLKLSASDLLKNDELLVKYLLDNNVPLSFNYVYHQELKEIHENRLQRSQEKCIITNSTSFEDDNNKLLAHKKNEPKGDPYVSAEKMKLFALAFSGGGIRSATFNLGILQGFAKKGLLHKFDYLSTVSGGGYIGSWLATWIKREGSVTKVSNRLNPGKSPDPLGEELRPIRWLRMFSNYFTPNASVMSVDSWTVGVTWLRNTLLNQLIIFLLLLALLFAGRITQVLWTNFSSPPFDSPDLLFISAAVLFTLIAVLAGFGMNYYNGRSNRVIPVKREGSSVFSFWVVAIVFIGAYFLSGLLFPAVGEPRIIWVKKLGALFPLAILAFVSLLVVAVMGQYTRCIMKFDKSLLAAILIIVFTAAIASLVTLVSIAGVWIILEKIRLNNLFSLPEQTAFVVGPPLVLVAFSLTVVARMALLGSFFPDERREWWGRIGGHVNRLSFLWIIIAAPALLGAEFINTIFKNLSVPATIGGWIALVGTTVKAAFSAKTSGKGETSKVDMALNILGKAGPYLFLFGLLIFLPGLMNPIEEILSTFIKSNFDFDIHRGYKILILVAFTGFSAYLLAKQVGVNEFSMHHFYRNRLVRAYLGATRIKTERQKSANPFTGFDMMDDEKLSEFKNVSNYYGPYPIINAALNATQSAELDRQDRKAESFTFSPFYCGFNFSMIKSSSDLKTKSYDYAYRPTEKFGYKDKGPGIGTAMAISGAAVNPNQGYHSSPATAFLLTVFNVQMGWWIGNPRKRFWNESDPPSGLAYIIKNLMGTTSTRNDYICLSDGGHFDNMGIYELVRRRCSFIILSDAEQDDQFTCEGLANAIRRCRIDFGAEIDINIDGITKRNKDGFSNNHYAIGKIKYIGEETPSGTLLYIKSSITGKEPVDVREYSLKNSTFPHQTTADQFFNEEQFESYRKLGMYIADLALKDPEVVESLQIKSDINFVEEDATKTNGTVTETYKVVQDMLVRKFKNLFSKD